MTQGLLAPWQTAILRSLGEDGISGEIAAPANGSITVFLYVPFPCTITGLSGKTSAGTLTASVQLDGVAVTGLDALAVSSVEINPTPTQGTTTAQASAGQTLAIVVSAVAAAANFAYVVKYRRPNQP